MRRMLIIIAGIIVLTGIGVALYFFFFANAPTLSVDTTPNPFGEAPDSLAPTDTSSEGSALVSEAGEYVAPRLVRITKGPVAAGNVVFSVGTTSSTGQGTGTSTLEAIPEKDYEIRYVERATGNVYSYLFNKRALTRISNKTIPGVQEAVWLSDGSQTYVRYLVQGENTTNSAVETYALPLSGEEGFFLEKDLSQVLAKNDGTVMTVLPSTSSTLVNMVDKGGRSLSSGFSVPLASLRIQFAGEDFLAVTRPSASLDGYAFLVEDTTDTLARVLGPFRGLSALPSPSGEFLLYHSLNKGALSLSLYDRTSRATIALPVSTLVEKCVWANDETKIYCGVPRALSGTLPDAWYQGAVAFSDRLWVIDVAGRVAALLVDPGTASEEEEPIDAVALTVDSGANVLVFTDKKTGALYAYDL